MVYCIRPCNIKERRAWPVIISKLDVIKNACNVLSNKQDSYVDGAFIRIRIIHKYTYYTI